MKKSISFVLVLSMLLAAMLGVTSVAEAEPAAAKLDISYANLMFTDSVYPLFAVDYTAVYTGDNAEASALAAIKLEVYRNGELVDTLSPSSEELGAPAGTIPFKQESFGFKNMGDIYTYRAVNGTAENASDDVEYSVLEYAVMAKATLDDKLANVVEKMLAVGAAAQTAFDYTDYDYDLNEKYGIVIVGGATAETRKTLAKVGESVTPVMNADAFPAGAELYDTTFEKTASGSVSVTEGVSRYFYFGTDIYGNGYGEYVTATDHASTNLDFDLVTSTGSYAHNEANPHTSTKTNYWGNRCITVTASKVIFNYESTAGWAETGNNRVWRINSTMSGSANSTAEKLAGYTGGVLTVAPGYLNIECIPDTPDGKTVGYTLSEVYGSSLPCIPHDPDNFLKDGKFTIGFSLAKKEGVDFSSTSSVCKIWGSDSNYVPLFSVDGDTLKYGDTVIVDFDTFTGDAPTAADYTTFYLVIDVNANTMTVHRDDGKTVTVMLDFSNANKATSMATWLSSAKQGFHWNFPGNGGSAYINRITYMVGDIFS